jgi:L-threonylcarbamoyladenylate synthase
VEHAVAAHVGKGGLAAHPTETVYGLGARVDGSGIESLRALKGREEGKPFLLLLPAPAEGRSPWDEPWGESLAWTAQARALAAAFWPGPLTLVLPDPGRSFPMGVRSQAGGGAVRGKPQPFVLGMLSALGEPLLSTSANRAGQPPARTLAGVRAVLAGRPGEERCWMVDGGELPPSPPSTLVDCTGRRPGVLRRGAIPADRIREVVLELDERNDA